MSCRRVDIAFFVSSLPASGGGGVQSNTLRLAAELASQGKVVDIVVAGDRGSALMHAPAGVRVVNLGASRTSRSLFRLCRYMNMACPDVLISAVALSNVIAVLAKKLSRSKTKIVLTERGHLSTYVREHHGLGFKVLPWLMRRTYPKADAIVAVSAGVAEDLSEKIGLLRSQIKVIYNPIVSHTFKNDCFQPCPHPWFQAGQPPVVIGVGRLVEQKAFHVLLRAFAKVRQEIDARLVILGEGELRQDLDDLIVRLGVADDVALPGHVANPYPYMRQAALFVLSSVYEGFGNVLVEAMATGTPVVSTDCPSGPGEILEHGRWGDLVPVGDVDAMAKRILDNLRLRKYLNVADRASYFTVGRSAKAYDDVISSIAGYP